MQTRGVAPSARKSTSNAWARLHAPNASLIARAQPSSTATAAPQAQEVAKPVLRPVPTAGAPQTGLSVEPSQYPQVRRGEVVETLHGVRVADPYRWLEDPDSEDTREFVDAQNALTARVLEQCDTREQFRQLFTDVFDYPKYGAPFKAGGRYYFYYNSGLQPQSALYSQAGLVPDTAAGEPRLFLDPSGLSSDGTVALSGLSFSEDGSLAAYSLSKGGSDWCTIQVLRVDPSGAPPTPLADKLEYVKFSSLAWTHDQRGFFYNRYPDPASRPADLGTETDINTHQQLCYHALGTPQSEDVLVMQVPDEHPTWMLAARVTPDGRFLVISVHAGTMPANRLYLVDMQALDKKADGAVDWAKYDHRNGSKKLPVVKLVDDFSASFSVVANEGTTFYIMTNLDAPRYRLVKIPDVTSAGPASSWPDHIAQHPKDVLRGALALKGDVLVVRYLRDVVAALQLRQLGSGALTKELPLPGVGSVGAMSGDRKGSELFFSFTSFTEPGALYRIDTAPGSSLEPQLFRRTELKVPHSADDYVTKQVFVTSADGTQVPMFITHHKDTKLDGSAPTLLYGYGGFNVPLEPGFSPNRLAFMRGYGGVFAQANLRGGGEYGTEWRNAGSTHNKQNVFDDFQACAEYLIRERYCSPAKLTIQGGSNGGLLVAACANQRPDLYACVLGQVGVMDMLRFHKFTIGHAWMTDYGNPDRAADFSWIYPYSPLHNVRAPEGGSRQYPAIMLATGDHDDRVVPLHTLKLLATLQHNLAAADPAASPQRNPLLARIEVKAGHGAGKPTQKVIAEAADLMGFAAKCMNAKWVDRA